jgi:AAA+ ATPase superfamily predicted ATPase
VFAGRKAALHQILSVLRVPGKPGCVSLLGERRIGKSSLLNQVYEALGKESGLIAIHATALNWNQNSQKQFYAGLHRAIAGALGLADVAEVADYPGLRQFIAGLAREHSHRFVLILDEFESLAGNPNFARISSTTCEPWANAPNTASASCCPAAARSKNSAATTTRLTPPGSGTSSAPGPC